MPLSLWLEYPAKGRDIYRINTNRKQCKQQIFRQRFDDNSAPSLANYPIYPNQPQEKKRRYRACDISPMVSNALTLFLSIALTIFNASQTKLAYLVQTSKARSLHSLQPVLFVQGKQTIFLLPVAFFLDY